MSTFELDRRSPFDPDFSGPSGKFTAQDFDFRHIIEVLRKYRKLLIFFTLLVFVLTLYKLSTITPVYRSTATLLIEPQKANIVSIEEIYDVDDQNSEYYQTQIELLKSRELARSTLQSLSLWNNVELIGEQDSEIVENDLESGSENTIQLRALRSFSGRLIVEPIRRTKLIRISYESTDSALAAEVANEVGRQYISSFLASKQKVTSDASEWLSGRLTELKSTLDASEKRLRDFQAR